MSKTGRPFALPVEIEQKFERFEKKLDNAAVQSETKVKRSNRANKTNTAPAKQQFKKKNRTEDDDWLCEICKRWYSEDAASKNGADWISCSFCFKTYHVHCQSQEFETNATIFKCDMCYAEEQF